MMRKPLQDFYLSKEDYQWLAGGLFDFPRKFNFNREQVFIITPQYLYHLK
jgi:hypothetical protein